MSKNLSAKYYQENKERLQKKARERYPNLSKGGKERKQQYGCEHYKNLSKDEKQKLVEYRKKHYRMKKMLFVIVRKYFNLEIFASLRGKPQETFFF